MRRSAAQIRRRGRVGREPLVRMQARDMIGEALAAPISRPGRALLTALGTILGVGLFVLTLGLTASTNAAVNEDFNSLISTEIDVSAGPKIANTVISPQTLQRASMLRGITALGPLAQLSSSITIAHYPQRPEDAGATSQISVLAATRGSLGVIGPLLARGRLFDEDQERRRAHVALIGGAAANILKMRNTPLPWSVSVGGEPFLVEGVIGRTERHADALLSVIIPYATARSLAGVSDESATPTIIVATKLGYTDAVAAALPARLYPSDPTQVTAAGLPQPTQLRNQISGNLTALFALLAGVGMIVGIVGITNSAVVSVMERISEIGVRRALGARRGQIALQFLLENLAIGSVGGILGVCLGVVAVTAVALARNWTPVLPIWVAVSAPIAGSLTGLLAGVYPALKAARADPVHALAR